MWHIHPVKISNLWHFVVVRDFIKSSIQQLSASYLRLQHCDWHENQAAMMAVKMFSHLTICTVSMFTYFQRRQQMKTTQQMTGGSSWTSVIRLEQQPMGELEKGISL